jgi:hypothetical protein
MRARLVLITGAVGLALALASCGGGTVPAGPSGAANRTGGTTVAPSVRTRRSGGYYRPAPRPTAVRLEASDSCVQARFDTLRGGSVTRLAPPRPGLAATLTGHQVRVEVDAGNPPAGCRPSGLLLTLDNDRGVNETVSLRRKLDHPRPRTVIVDIPRGFAGAPTVVHAITGSAVGVPSETASVRVR